MGSTPEERSLRARIAAHSKWARTEDASAATAPARSAFDERFLNEVDPDRKLPEVERARRAEAARKAHFARLALKSVTARRKAKEARAAQLKAEADLRRGQEGAA